MAGTSGVWKRRLGMIAGAGLFLVLSAGFIAPADSDFYQKVTRGIEVYGRVYKDVSVNYVDDIDPDKFMQAGIEGMLGSLDPYTTYIDQEDGDEVDLLTNGKYGGIGVTIGIRDGGVRVITVMDGYSAQRQGIVPGDRLLTVDGVAVAGKRPDEVRSLTRGEPGTEVTVTVEREGEARPLEFVLIREEIQVRNVTYADFVEPGIAYIRLERFSRKAGDELRQSIKELKLKGEIAGVILDLRGNPGGLLDAAVDVVSKFVPRGTVVVRTKGRRPDADREYRTEEEPLLLTTPLAVLTDRGSASASEIVCGSLQDFDRAVIVGTRTFGKGLVQTILPLPYGAQLKITTARYFIPSGRSIQEVDYMHRDHNGVFATVPDSMKKVFRTVHGRTVMEHGGIAPDSIVTEEDDGPMVRELHRKALFFKFVSRWVAAHKEEQGAGVNDSTLGAFRRFLAAEKFDFQEEAAAKIQELRQIASRSHYAPEVLTDLDLLASALDREKGRGFDRYLDHLREELTMEFLARTKGERGRIEASLAGDRPVGTAIGILKNRKWYDRRLRG
jgi:carboxyl-terminal processing protease